MNINPVVGAASVTGKERPWGAEGRVSPEWLDDSIAKGKQALAGLLPWELLEPERRYDATLLFLVFPVGSVDDTIAARIVEDVTTPLLGSYAIWRYPGDSYWLPDYTEPFPPD